MRRRRRSAERGIEALLIAGEVNKVAFEPEVVRALDGVGLSGGVEGLGFRRVEQDGTAPKQAVIHRYKSQGKPLWRMMEDRVPAGSSLRLAGTTARRGPLVNLRWLST